jgi:hypothetical protein
MSAAPGSLSLTVQRVAERPVQRDLQPLGGDLAQRAIHELDAIVAKALARRPVHKLNASVLIKVREPHEHVVGDCPDEALTSCAKPRETVCAPIFAADAVMHKEQPVRIPPIFDRAQA